MILNNKTETPLVLLSYEGTDKVKEYMNRMMKHYDNKIKSFADADNYDFNKLYSNIRDLIDQEVNQYNIDLS